jgi:hypothetical protein
VFRPLLIAKIRMPPDSLLVEKICVSLAAEEEDQICMKKLQLLLDLF